MSKYLPEGLPISTEGGPEKGPGAGISDWYSGLDPGTQGALTDYYNDIMYDTFASDGLYQAVFLQGDWGKIEDATFETFAEVKTYINDTLFATEHQTVYSDDEYVPSVDRALGDDPIYLDVSEYYAEVDRSLPKLYKKPDPIAMPQQLISRYSSFDYKLKTGGGVEEGWENFYSRGERFQDAAFDPETGEATPSYAGDVDTFGSYQAHLEKVEASRLQAGQEDFQNLLAEDKARADSIWERRTMLEGTYWGDPPYNLQEISVGHYDEKLAPLFKHVIGSDEKEDIQAWMAMAGINNTRDDPDRDWTDFKRLKYVYDWFEGKLPTREEFETKYGDPLVHWQHVKDEYNPFEDDELQGKLEKGPRWTEYH
jgi:hypothetical protein